MMESPVTDGSGSPWVRSAPRASPQPGHGVAVSTMSRGRMIRTHVAAEGWRCCGRQKQTRRLISSDANKQRGSASQGDKTAKTLAPQSAGNRRIVLSPRPSTTSLPTQPRFILPLHRWKTSTLI